MTYMQGGQLVFIYKQEWTGNRAVNTSEIIRPYISAENCFSQRPTFEEGTVTIRLERV